MLERWLTRAGLSNRDLGLAALVLVFFVTVSVGMKVQDRLRGVR